MPCRLISARCTDRCKNSEETRQFYEDFIGLPMVDALHIKMNGEEDVLHTFFQFDDGSCIAFFDARTQPPVVHSGVTRSSPRCWHA